MRSELLSASGWKDYELLDSGRFEKLERFGRYVLARPEPQAVWDRSLSEDEWSKLCMASAALSQTDIRIDDNPSVTVADINAVADPILDAQVFDMTNSITAGKYDDAARVLGELLRMQTEPIVILAAVGKELRRLYTARMALDGGKDRLWLKQLWNMSSDYPAKLLMQAARKVDHDWCRTAVLRCQQLDRRMKSMSMPDKQKEDELKLFLMELAGRR